MTKTVQTAPALSGNQMWAVIIGLVAYHDACCEENQTLSESVDRGLEKYRLLIYTIVLVTVAHLLNWLRPESDPYHRFGLFFKNLKGTT